EPKLLAEQFGVKESEVIEMERRLSVAGSEVSLEAPMGGEESASNRHHVLPDEAIPVDELMESEEMKAILVDELEGFAKSLSAREQHILRERLLSELPNTLQEIADKYGISRERARQIEAKILKKLRARMEAAIK